MKPLKPEIYRKNNSLIESYSPNWGINETKLLNSLVYKFFKSTNKDLIIKNKGFIISYSDIRKLMGLENKGYIEKINHSLDVLKKTDLILNNFNKYATLHTSIILQWGTLKKYDKQDKNQKIEIVINTDLYQSFIDKNSFTLLDIKSNQLRGKYTIKLYELIKMKSNQHNPQTKRKVTDKVMYLDELNEYFNTSHKHISRFKEHLLLSRNKLIEKDFLDDLEIQFFKDKIVFIFNELELFSFSD